MTASSCCGTHPTVGTGKGDLKRGPVATMGETASQRREQIREGNQLEDRLSWAFGIVASAMGLVLVVGGLSPNYAGATGGIGLVFGALGHLLGARRLGGAVVVVSVAEIVIGLLP